MHPSSVAAKAADAFASTRWTLVLAHIFDTNTLASLTVGRTATIAGFLQTAVDDVSVISPSDSFTLLTAQQINGQFCNVASGGRVDAFVGFNTDNSPKGDPIGSFLVTYDNTTFVLSDFQPANNPSSSERRKPAVGKSWLDKRSSPDSGEE